MHFILFNKHSTSFMKNTICTARLTSMCLCLFPCSNGVGRRRAAHLWRGGHGHRQPPIHRRCVHPHDVPARQGHGKNGQKRPPHVKVFLWKWGNCLRTLCLLKSLRHSWFEIEKYKIREWLRGFRKCHRRLEQLRWKFRFWVNYAFHDINWFL